MKLFRKPLTWLVLLGLVGLAYGLIQHQANQSAQRAVDAALAEQVSPFAKVSYSDVSVNLFTQAISVDDLKISPQLAPDQPPILMQQLTLKAKKNAEDQLLKLDLHLKNIQIPLDVEGLGQSAKAVFEGLPQDYLTADLDVDFDYQPESQTWRLDTYTRLLDLGDFNFNLALDNFRTDRETITQYSSVELDEATLAYEEVTLVKRLLKAGAKANNVSEERYVDALLQGLQQQAGANASPQTQAVMAQWKKFLQDPKNLTITLHPDAPIPLMSLSQMSTPAMIEKLNMIVVANQ